VVSPTGRLGFLAGCELRPPRNTTMFRYVAFLRGRARRASSQLSRSDEARPRVMDPTSLEWNMIGDNKDLKHPRQTHSSASTPRSSPSSPVSSEGSGCSRHELAGAKGGPMGPNGSGWSTALSLSAIFIGLQRELTPGAHRLLGLRVLRAVRTGGPALQLGGPSAHDEPFGGSVR